MDLFSMHTMWKCLQGCLGNEALGSKCLFLEFCRHFNVRDLYFNVCYFYETVGWVT